MLPVSWGQYAMNFHKDSKSSQPNMKNLQLPLYASHYKYLKKKSVSLLLNQTHQLSAFFWNTMGYLMPDKGPQNGGNVTILWHREVTDNEFKKKVKQNY